MREARRFFSREKQVFLVGFSLTFPRLSCKSKNLLNTSLGETFTYRKLCQSPKLTFIFNVLITYYDRFKVTEIESVHVLKLLKLINASARYQNSSDTRFLRAGQLYFNHDVFSCAMVLLIIFLSKIRINFIYLNITYV